LTAVFGQSGPEMRFFRTIAFYIFLVPPSKLYDNSELGVHGIFHAADDRPCRIMDTSYLKLYNFCIFCSTIKCLSD